MRAVLATVATSLAALVLLAGCGTETSPRGTDPESVESGERLPEVVPWDNEGFAPPITLDLDGERVPIEAWAACYATGCYDGMPQRPYYDVGDPDLVPFSFPDPGWEFEATFKEAGVEKCYREITVPVRKTSDRTFVIEPAGPAGDWDVDVFGRGPTGDVIATFTWSTPEDATLPDQATGTAAVLADHDGELDSYGVEIGVRDLATHPERAEARVTVTGASGRSVTIETHERDERCWTKGQLWFTASDEQGRRATELGAGPFRYTVELVLDGATYTGVGEWPTGETEEIAPHVPLTWTPELPVYRG